MTFEKVEGAVWTPIRVKPKQEKKLADYCQAVDVQYYLPLIKRMHRYERKTCEFTVPMFPGYLFCLLDDATYTKLLPSNTIVYRIPVNEAEEIELLEELKSIRIFEMLSEQDDVVIKPELVQGVKVNVTSGPLQGTCGIIEFRKGKVCVSINVEILGHSVSVEVDAGEVEVEK